MFVKKFVCALLIACTLTMSVSSPCYEAREVVKAAAIPVIGEIAWEVILSILISLGITVEVYDIASGNNVYQQAAEKIKEDFNDWSVLESSKHDDETDPEWRQKAFYAVLEEGTQIAQTGQGGELVLPQDLWNSLREWSKSRIFEKEILPELEENDARLLAFKAIEDAYPNIYYPKYRLIVDDVGGGGTNLSYYWFDVPVNFRNYPYYNRNGALVTGYYYDYSFNKIYDGYYTYVALGTETPFRYTRYKDSISGKFRGQAYSEDEFNSKGVTGYDVAFMSGRIVWANYDYRMTYTPPECALEGNDRDMKYRLIDSDGMGNAIASGDYDVVTAGRTYNGTEMNGDVTINIPDANTASQIVGGIMTGSQAQKELGVTPVDVTMNKPLVEPVPGAEPVPDIDTSISEAEKTQDQRQLKNIGAKMATLFPFCIPFDIKDSFKAMVAVQKAPVFETDIEFPSINFSYHIKIDMSEFETQVLIFRWGMILLFCVGLMLSTYQLIKWHDGGD